MIIRLFLIFSFLVYGMTFSFCETIKIKFATVAPDGTSWMKTMHEFNKELKMKTNGRVSFIFYPGGIAGDEKDILRKMRYGKIHATGLTGLGMGAILSESRILDLPFFFHNEKQIDKVHNKLFGYFEKQFSSKGYELIAWSEIGWTYLFSQKNLDDFKEYSKLKMWTWEGDPVALKTLNELNMNPISLSMANVLTSLERGMIDTVYTPPFAAIAMQWNTKLKYFLNYPLVHSSGAFLIINKIFKKLSKEDAVILKKSGKKYFQQLKLDTRIENLKAIESMKSNGIQIIEPSENLKEIFQKASEKVINSLQGSLFESELLDKIKKIIKSENQSTGE